MSTSEQHIPAGARARLFRIVETVLLTVSAVFYALHFVHLRADFPNHSPWSDWAKFTDEGWYGLAAIRHYQLGHWNVPGDFNPGAALPVWPLLLLVLFRFTGVSLLAARALTVAAFGAILIWCYLLLRRWAADQNETQSLAPAIAVLLLAASPFYFAFSRLAILEPLMVLLALKGLMVAERAGISGLAAWHTTRDATLPRKRGAAVAWSACLGLLCVAVVLAKTTGLFLVLALAWMLWAGGAYRVRVVLRTGVLAAATAIGVWGGYMLVVRPHYMQDYRYLFAANAYTGISAATFRRVVADTFLDSKYLGAAFSCLGLAAAALLLASSASRRFRRDALTVSLLLWTSFYFAFLAYHDNLQPRYYQALGVPLAMLIAMAFDRLWRFAMRPGGANADPVLILRHPALRALLLLAAAGLGASILCVAIRGGAQEVWYVEHPEYTFLNAANLIHDAIEQQRAEDRAAGAAVHPELVLSISGAEMQLMTGLPSICDDFGTMTLPDRIAAYHPGWFVAWNDVEDDKMEALAPAYRLVRMGEWPALDDPDRNLLILYRLDPLASPGRGQPRPRRAVKLHGHRR